MDINESVGHQVRYNIMTTIDKIRAIHKQLGIVGEPRAVFGNCVDRLLKDDIIHSYIYGEQLHMDDWVMQSPEAQKYLAETMYEVYVRKIKEFINTQLENEKKLIIEDKAFTLLGFRL